MPLDASATATTATKSATYLVNRRLRIFARFGATADASSAAAEAASVRPSGVSGCSEMLIGPQVSKKVQACLLPQCGRSLDNFVRNRQQGRRDLEPGSLGRLEVEDKKIAGRLLERQVGRTGT